MELKSMCCSNYRHCMDHLPAYRVPIGLEDVSKYPFLFAELIQRGYSDSDITKISRTNFLRVFEAVEKVGS